MVYGTSNESLINNNVNINKNANGNGRKRRPINGHTNNTNAIDDNTTVNVATILANVECTTLTNSPYHIKSAARNRNVPTIVNHN
jgi:hypothetical protein